MSCTRPTSTPALRTAAWGLSPPMLSKRAVMREPDCHCRLSKLADCSARNTSASTPSSTNRPTHRSFFERCICRCFLHLPVSHQLNIRAVRMKSSASTASEASTTVRVVARATPSGGGEGGGGGGGGGGAARHAFGRGPGHIALQQRHKAYGKAEDQALEHPIAQVAPDIHAALHLAPEGPRVYAYHQHAHHGAADHADGAEHRCQIGRHH